ncbi:hypothetical protein WG947_01140 [Pontibacter sp. H259]|uniref:hypothetical protein n=1 Tax=Pontibacter sp. H259 TaxID=3133421 RepID=UPI0030BE7F82
MAEINIERRKKPVWPWILLLLIVALLIWAIYEMTNDRDDIDTEEVQETGMLLPAENYTPQVYATTA